MPILFGIFGVILIVSGVKGTVTGSSPSLMSLLKDDFTGTNPFWKWMLAILFIGAVGYIPNMRPISRAFMALVIIVFLMSNQGVFSQLQSAFKSTSTSGTSTASTGGTSSALGTDSATQTLLNSIEGKL